MQDEHEGECRAECVAQAVKTEARLYLPFRHKCADEPKKRSAQPALGERLAPSTDKDHGADPSVSNGEQSGPRIGIQ